MRLVFISICIVLISNFSAGATTQPATAPAVDPQLWKQLVEIDRRASSIKDLSASFEQKKFTPLLKKPLISSGTIRVKGSAMLWDTKAPEPTQMRIDEHEAAIFYPRQKVEEIYPIDERLGELAASPLPRLDVLKKRFSFQPGEQNDESGIQVHLLPIDDALKDHIEAVSVLLDPKTGVIQRAEMVDADGDRTVLSFSNIKTNAGLSDDELKLQIPSGTKISRPLEGMEGSMPARRGMRQ